MRASTIVYMHDSLKRIEGGQTLSRAHSGAFHKFVPDVCQFSVCRFKGIDLGWHISVCRFQTIDLDLSWQISFSFLSSLFLICTVNRRISSNKKPNICTIPLQKSPDTSKSQPEHCSRTLLTLMKCPLLSHALLREETEEEGDIEIRI